MTGYRLGFVITPNKNALHIMSELDEKIYGGVPHFIQKGAIAALKQESKYSSIIRHTYLKRRNHRPYLLEIVMADIFVNKNINIKKAVTDNEYACITS